MPLSSGYLPLTSVSLPKAVLSSSRPSTDTASPLSSATVGAANGSRRRLLLGSAALAGSGAGLSLAPTAGVAADSQVAPAIPLPRPEVAPISPSAARLAAPAAVGPRYKLVFADEFDDDRVERINEDGKFPDKQAIAWRSRYRHPRKDIINQEKQIYVDPAFAGTGEQPLGIQPFSIANGVLTITADRLDPVTQSPRLWGQRFSSGVITSEFSHAQQYGYFEMRARMPIGNGFWPSFWLVTHRDAWPPELDIFEASGSRPDKVHFAIHEVGPKLPSQASGWVDLPRRGRIDGFHRYGMEWTAEAIHWFVDDQRLFSFKGHQVHEPMHMRINMAVGSHEPYWIPDPDASTPFPGRFEIDYVRAYQR